MARTIVGLFGSVNTAQDAVKDLAAAGFDRANISVISNAGAHPPADEDLAPPVVAGAGVGAASGALLGGTTGLLAAAGVLVIPGIGPILAAGPLVAMLAVAGVGAVAGAVAGGLVGVLMDLGIPEREARHYEAGVRAGGTLVTMTVDERRSADAEQILRRAGAVDIDPLNRPRTNTPGRRAGEPAPARQTSERRPAGSEAQGTFLASDASDADESDLREEDFRRHFDAALRRPGESFEYYAPAYEYGTLLADEMTGRDWDLSMGRIRDLWERDNPGTWDRYADAIRYGWDRRRERR